MLLWLKLILVGAGKFIRKYWKAILIVALILGWTYSVYSWSMQKADMILIKDHNKKVKVLNDKIEAIEKKSEADADTAEATRAALVLRFAEILNNKPPIVPRDKDNKPLVCKDGTEIKEIYLGLDFSARWNMLNDEVNK